MATTPTRRHFLQSAAGGVLAAATIPTTGLGSAPRFDVVIRGGTIVDGTGSRGSRNDLGIRGDRVAAIGNLARRRHKAIRQRHRPDRLSGFHRHALPQRQFLAGGRAGPQCGPTGSNHSRHRQLRQFSGTSGFSGPLGRPHAEHLRRLPEGSPKEWHLDQRLWPGWSQQCPQSCDGNTEQATHPGRTQTDARPRR
ncbi:MAG: hypothetical protein Ct9H300mP1_36340 [Planctomycetaceae bacterium]|nr:MAG: hypothetical protein Ct9H300mP1_36340 [Planctomycetaceae bacterium]